MIQINRLTFTCFAALGLVLAATPAASAATSPPPPSAVSAAGDPVGSIAWHPCAMNAQDEEGKTLDEAGVECGDVTVPVNYAKPRGRTMTVAIARSRATDQTRRIGSLIINLGGPALPVLSVVPLARDAMGQAGSRFDLIGMDPRFSGRSTPLDCHWPGSWLPRSAGADRESFDRMVALARDLAKRCGQTHAADIPYASTANTARDIDTIRAALGESKMSYLGYSQGTFLGAVYAQMFPQRVDRLVLDSAVNPTRPGTYLLRDGEPGRQAALGEWAEWAAARDDEFGLGSTAKEVLATVNEVYAASARKPLKIGGYAIDDTVVPAIIIRSLSDDATNAELAETVATLSAIAKGGTGELTESLADVLSSVLTDAESALHSPQTAIMCGDAAAPRNPRWYWRDIQAHRAASPLFAPMSRTITPCAFWPNSPLERPVHIANGVPALIVQAEKDINSQLPGARKMHQALKGSRMVTLQGARTHGVYGFRGASCVDDSVNAYLESGSMPQADVTCTE
ncbi:alpha/beta hydrolase [Actinoplanes sp. NPDC049681]|uniref:alpha/beta hydrolase n=1 Tax=Actinoplanes sp. NPDC049681 TaxID=3363905 RepID=UPI0037B2F225